MNLWLYQSKENLKGYKQSYELRELLSKSATKNS